jgi:hypothetical protein
MQIYTLLLQQQHNLPACISRKAEKHEHIFKKTSLTTVPELTAEKQHSHTTVRLSRVRIFRPFKEPRNRFPAWRVGTTTLFDVPALCRQNRLQES